jgi:tetratricopeptide (TPR) repeat protein
MLLLYRAILQLETGRSESAWETLHEAESAGLSDLRTGSRHPFASLLLARVPEFEKAPGSYDGTDVEVLEGLTKKHPEHMGLHMRLARIVDLLGQRDRARALYDQAFEKNTTLFVAAYRSGELAIAANDLETACEVIDRSAAVAGERFPASILAIKAWVMRKNGSEVAKRLRPFVTRQEPTPETLDLLKDLGSEVGVLIDALKEDVQKTPHQPFLLAHLALAYHLDGKAEEARATALLAERWGLSGHDGRPAWLLYVVHGEEPPAAVIKAMRR